MVGWANKLPPSGFADACGRLNFAQKSFLEAMARSSSSSCSCCCCKVAGLGVMGCCCCELAGLGVMGCCCCKLAGLGGMGCCCCKLAGLGAMGCCCCCKLAGLGVVGCFEFGKAPLQVRSTAIGVGTCSTLGCTSALIKSPKHPGFAANTGFDANLPKACST